jgi:hypothetical protein
MDLSKSTEVKDGHEHSLGNLGSFIRFDIKAVEFILVTFLPLSSQLDHCEMPGAVAEL